MAYQGEGKYSVLFTIKLECPLFYPDGAESTLRVKKFITDYI
jgi:hypothetical protein